MVAYKCNFMRKHFLRVFIPSLALALLVTSLIYRLHYTNNKTFIQNESLDYLNAATGELADNTFQVGRSLLRISNQASLDEVFTPRLLARSMNGLMESRPEIDHIRLINNEGFEQIRFNREGNKIIRVTDSALQDKSSRPYFIQSRELGPQEVVLTSLNVNQEFGEYTKPYELHTRWIVPVYNSNGEKEGVLVANINFNNVIAFTEQRMRTKHGSILVRSKDSALYQAGRVVLKGRADSIIDFYTGGILTDDSIVETREGLLVQIDASSPVRSIKERMLSIGAASFSANQGNSKVLYWISGEYYYDRVHENRLYIIILQSFISLVILFFSYRWAKFRVQEELTFDELYKSNQLLRKSEAELADAKIKLEEKVAVQESEIDDAQRLMTALFDSSMHFAGIMKPDGTLININRKTLSITGQKKSNVVGKKIWEFDLFGDKELVKNSMGYAIEQAINGESVKFESAMLDKNGNKRRIAFSLSPLFDDSGKITHLIPEGSDITEIREKDKQLQVVIQQLEARNNQLKEFSHIVSHNVRSPIGNLGLLLSIYEDAENDEERSEIVDKIKLVNTSLLELLEELLETVKILDNSEISTELNKLDVCIVQAQKLLTRQIEEADVRFNIELKELEVYYPRVYLNSLLLNLMSNAIKYRSEDRQLVLTIKTYRNDKDRVQLEFSDNGSGIDMKKNGHKIFGLYKTFHRNKPGKGLGLFMTKTQIESHGGTIQVKSELNKGTTFIITFPNPPISH